MVFSSRLNLFYQGFLCWRIEFYFPVYTSQIRIHHWPKRIKYINIIRNKQTSVWYIGQIIKRAQKILKIVIPKASKICDYSLMINFYTTLFSLPLKMRFLYVIGINLILNINRTSKKFQKDHLWWKLVDYASF